jgi:Atrophin-1 family.
MWNIKPISKYDRNISDHFRENFNRTAVIPTSHREITGYAIPEGYTTPRQTSSKYKPANNSLVHKSLNIQHYQEKFPDTRTITEGDVIYECLESSRHSEREKEEKEKLKQKAREREREREREKEKEKEKEREREREREKLREKNNATPTSNKTVDPLKPGRSSHSPSPLGKSSYQVKK